MPVPYNLLLIFGKRFKAFSALSIALRFLFLGLKELAFFSVALLNFKRRKAIADFFTALDSMYA